MPAVAVAVVAAYASSAIATSAAVIAAVGSTMASVLGAVAAMAISYMGSALMGGGGDKGGDQAPALTSDAESRTQMVRQAITPWRTIYGRVKVSGPITFLHSNGSNNNKAHLLLTLACHEIDGHEEVYFGDELVTFDGDHKATGRWAGFARCWVGTGSVSGDADLQAALEAACPGIWTNEHRQYGRAKIYVEFTWDEKMFSAGLPTVKVLVRGKKVYDPRSAETGFSSNAALCIRDYLTTQDVGIGALASEILDSDTIASANVSDESVACLRSELIPQGEGTAIGDMTGNDGLSAAFDGTSSTSQTHSAYSSAAIGTVGKHWAAARKIGRVMAYSPSSGGWSQGWTGDVTLRLRGSNDGVTWTVLCAETVTDGESEQLTWNPDTADITATTAYAYHDLQIDATGSGGGVYCAEVRFYELVGTETRYTCNGTVESDKTPKDIIGRLLTSCAGNVIFSGGFWSILAGYYRTPTITLTDDDFTGPVKLIGRASRRESFNAVKGVYVSPDYNWEASDGPPVRNGTYEVEDGRDFEAFTVNLPSGTLSASSKVPAGTALRLWTGGILPSPLSEDVTYFAVPQGGASIKVAATRDDAMASSPVTIPITSAGSGTHRLRYGQVVWSDSDAPFTTSPSMFQRLAKIKLERAHQAQTLEVSCGLRKAIKLRPGGVVMVTRERFGWVNKPFDISEWNFEVQEDSAGAPVLGIRPILKETSATVYDWNSGEETVIDPAPDTNLPPPWDVSPPSSIALSAGTGELLLMGDGTVVTRLLATWTDPAQVGIDHIDVQIRETSGTDWRDCPAVLPGIEAAYLSPVVDRVSYRVRLRTVTRIGAPSGWVESSDLTVVGKSEPPADVRGFSAGMNGAVAVLKWTGNTEADLGGYSMKYGPIGGSWESKIPLDPATKTTQITTAQIPPGNWEVSIKAVDTSRNESVNAATAPLTVTNLNTTIASSPQAPDWPGIIYGFVKHWTGVLIPDSTMLAADMTDAELWDTFVYSPVSSCTYTQSGEQVLTINGSPRLWAAVTAVLGPGETAGSATPQIEVATRTLAGTYGAWQPWTIGTAPCGAFKMRVTITPANGVALLSAFTPTADASLQTETQTVSVGSGGTAVTYSAPFFSNPSVSVQPVGATAQIGQPSNVTTADCIAHTFNGATGAGESGTATVTITGPR